MPEGNGGAQSPRGVFPANGPPDEMGAASAQKAEWSSGMQSTRGAAAGGPNFGRDDLGYGDTPGALDTPVSPRRSVHPRK